MAERRKNSRPSRMSLDEPNKPSSYNPDARAFLTPLLPLGWQKYFNIKKAGKYWGLSLVCPVCREAPPSKLTGSRKWRWLAVHISKHKPVRL